MILSPMEVVSEGGNREKVAKKEKHDELKFDFFMASDDVDGRDFFGGYPFESGVKNRSRGSNCQGGTKD